jgi:hypothetical protein
LIYLFLLIYLFIYCVKNRFGPVQCQWLVETRKLANRFFMDLDSRVDSVEKTRFEKGSSCNLPEMGLSHREESLSFIAAIENGGSSILELERCSVLDCSYSHMLWTEGLYGSGNCPRITHVKNTPTSNQNK